MKFYIFRISGENSMGCYKRFAEIYDTLINGDISYNDWADAIKKICLKYNINFDDYIDLGCGTGNMTASLSKTCNFKNVWAADISSEMLTKAEIKLRERGIHCNFICEDITHLNVKRKFDLVTCCLDCTNYILKKEDLSNYFKGVYSILKNGALFIFDINSYYKISTILGNNIYSFDNDDIVYIWENVFEDDIVDMYLTFFVREGKLYRRFDELHSERAYSEKTIEDELNKCGFSIIEKKDGYTEKSVEENTERIVYVVKK